MINTRKIILDWIAGTSNGVTRSELVNKIREIHGHKAVSNREARGRYINYLRPVRIRIRLKYLQQAEHAYLDSAGTYMKPHKKDDRYLRKISGRYFVFDDISYETFNFIIDKLADFYQIDREPQPISISQDLEAWKQNVLNAAVPEELISRFVIDGSSIVWR